MINMTAKKLAIILSILLVVITILFCVILFSQPESIQISNVFVDINGDGRLDYIKSAEVIMNTDDTANFLASQLQE